MTWMLVSYPCCKRRDRATQRTALMDCHYTRCHCIHYTCDDCYHRSSKQEFQTSMGLVVVSLVLTVYVAPPRQVCSLKYSDPVLIGTYPAPE